jgi:ABC-2 type transport system permease protein
MELIKGLLLRRGVPVSGLPPIDAQVRVWFNPQVDSSTTIVPGLIAVNMVLMAALLTSLTIVRERELGSLESLFATPVRRLEILVGKILPYMGIALLDCVLSALIGVAVFDVPFRGSIALFLGASLIFTFTGLSIGLLASVVSGTAMLSNQIVVLTTMLPSMLLSGFMFPIASMPGWVQVITHAVPARYFVAICRGIMLKAQPWTALAGPTLLLLAVGAVLFTLANLRFRKKL